MQCNFAARVLHVRACMSVSEKFHSVYSAVEKERKGKERRDCHIPPRMSDLRIKERSFLQLGLH